MLHLFLYYMVLIFLYRLILLFYFEIHILYGRGVRDAVWCGFGQFLIPYFAVQFRQNHNCTASHFCGHMCGAVWCSAV